MTLLNTDVTSPIRSAGRGGVGIKEPGSHSSDDHTTANKEKWDEMLEIFDKVQPRNKDYDWKEDYAQALEEKYENIC